MKQSTAPTRYKKAHIDSFNFNSVSIEDSLQSDDFSIEVIKSIGIFKPQQWCRTFKKPLTKNIVEAKIIYTDTFVLALKRQSRNPHRQTIEFAGIHSYNNKYMEDKKALLRMLLKEIEDGEISRIDIAIDYDKPIPERVLRKLRKNRTPYIFRNSIYLKTEKEKKKNEYININIYPKHIKDNLTKDVYRLEFSFRGGYFKGNNDTKNLKEIILKMTKTIKKFTGLDIEIKPV